MIAKLVLIVVLLVPTAVAGPFEFTFEVTPASGQVFGAPGARIGWGYSISNLDPLNWLVTSNLSTDPFLFATPDGSVFDFPIIAPMTTVSVPYDGTTGLYQITWDTTATLAFTNSGLFALAADWYDGDPFAGGILIQPAPTSFAAYSATVADVPEPSTLISLGSCLAAIVVRRLTRV